MPGATAKTTPATPASHAPCAAAGHHGADAAQVGVKTATEGDQEGAGEVGGAAAGMDAEPGVGAAAGTPAGLDSEAIRQVASIAAQAAAAAAATAFGAQARQQAARRAAHGHENLALDNRDSGRQEYLPEGEALGALGEAWNYGRM